jgi:hypothetical protein
MLTLTLPPSHVVSVATKWSKESRGWKPSGTSIAGLTRPSRDDSSFSSPAQLPLVGSGP